MYYIYLQSFLTLIGLFTRKLRNFLFPKNCISFDIFNNIFVDFRIFANVVRSTFKMRISIKLNSTEFVIKAVISINRRGRAQSKISIKIPLKFKFSSSATQKRNIRSSWNASARSSARPSEANSGPSRNKRTPRLPEGTRKTSSRRL